MGLRIAYLCYGLNVGGVQKLAVNLANAAAEAGSEAFYVYGVDGALQASLDSRVQVVRYGNDRLTYRRPIEVWLSAKRIAEAARGEGWDVIHAFDVMSWCVAAIAGRIADIPVVRTQPNFIRRYERKNARTIHILPFARWTDRFHALQEATAHDLVAAGIPAYKVFVENRTLKVSHPGTRDKIRTEYGIEEDAKVVISVGRLVEGKGWELVPSIAREVYLLNRNARFWIVGDGPLRTVVEDRVTAEGLMEIVRFMGERTDVDALYEAADIALFPCCTHAGMGVASAFVPLVAGNGPCQREQIIHGRTGLLCAHDVTEYAAAVSMLIQDDIRRSELADNARRCFDRDRSVDYGIWQFLDVYRGLSGAGKSAG